MRTITLAEAQDRLDEVMDQVAADGSPILIKGEDGTNAVMIPAEVWAAAEEAGCSTA